MLSGPRAFVLLVSLSSFVVLVGCGATTGTIAQDAAAASKALVAAEERPAIQSFAADPPVVKKGDLTTLTWTTTNATSVTLVPPVYLEDGQRLPVNGRTTGLPDTTTTYMLIAKGTHGSARATVTVRVEPADPTVALNVTPNPIVAGQEATLSWTSQNARTVTIDNGIGSVPPSGSVTITPTADTTYTAAATGTTTTSTTTATTIVLSRPPRPERVTGNLNSIKHIIFFAQENRSFDNYFGLLGQYRAAKGLPNNVDGLNLSAAQYDQNGVAVHPYHQVTVCAENTSPSWNPSWHAYDGGKMDGFVSAHDLPTTLDPQYHRTMAYYNQNDLPYYYELATQFATSDRFFGSLLSATIPNRMYLFGATSAGHIFPDSPPSGGFPIKTIFEELQAAGISWRYYYMDNSVFLSQFEAWNDSAIRNNVRNISEYFSILADANADTLLPQVIFIERGASSGLDEHPDNNTQTGAAKAAQIINALLASKAWPSSVFIHTYDEFGGLYDHVAPIAVPAPDNIQPIASPGYETPYPGDFAHSDFRLPLIVISPWVKTHFVSHKPRELTSILKFIERRFGLSPLTARDAWADDMTEFFDFSTPSQLTPPPLPAQPTNGTCDINKELTGQN